MSLTVILALLHDTILCMLDLLYSLGAYTFYLYASSCFADKHFTYLGYNYYVCIISTLLFQTTIASMFI